MGYANIIAEKSSKISTPSQLESAKVKKRKENEKAGDVCTKRSGKRYINNVRGFPCAQLRLGVIIGVAPRPCWPSDASSRVVSGRRGRSSLFGVIPPSLGSLGTSSTTRMLRWTSCRAPCQRGSSGLRKNSI